MLQSVLRRCGVCVIAPIVLSSTLIVIAGSRRDTPFEPDSSVSLSALLDADGDGRVTRWEGAAAWLDIVRDFDGNADGAVERKELIAGLARLEKEEMAERVALFREFDRDGNGTLEPQELPREWRDGFASADVDASGGVTLNELAAFESSDDMAAMIQREADEIIARLDRNDDGAISRSEIPSEDLPLFDEADADENGAVTRQELVAVFVAENAGAVFDVDGDRAVMHGTIGASTPGRVLELIVEHPNVRTIVMTDVPGSMDDEANLRAARLVHRAGFEIRVPTDGMIASGGVDFFLAGKVRRVAKGARLGVHSWGGPVPPTKLPKDHEEHRKYLDFYRHVGIPESFYWFTLEAAPADDIHWMSRKEMRRYRVVIDVGEETDERDEDVEGDRTFDTDAGFSGEDKSTIETSVRSAYGLDAVDIAQAPRGIATLPGTVSPVLRRHFDRYTRVVAPNGRPIHILAQAAWRTDQIVRARKILEHFLTDVPGTRFGANKTPVANAMADRRATLVLFENEPAMERALRGRLGGLDLGFQDLRANECPVEGDDDYLGCITRDAAFEEILHLVHDYGIRPALPKYDRLLQGANLAAAKRGFWDPWPEDEPDSHRNEYIAAAYDNYLDLWVVPLRRYEGRRLSADDLPKGTTHFGTFRANGRAMMKQKDRAVFDLVEMFLPKHLTYLPELPEDFDGTFSISFDKASPYTTKSRRLRGVILRGDRDASLVGNDANNVLIGNGGRNTFEGRGGDDALTGDAGIDTAEFRGPRSDYFVERRGETLVVRDKVAGRDGTDSLRSIERLRFSNAVIVEVDR